MTTTLERFRITSDDARRDPDVRAIRRQSGLFDGVWFDDVCPASDHQTLPGSVIALIRMHSLVVAI